MLHGICLRSGSTSASNSLNARPGATTSIERISVSGDSVVGVDLMSLHCASNMEAAGMLLLLGLSRKLVGCLKREGPHEPA